MVSISSSQMRIMLILAVSHVVVFFLGTLRVLVSSGGTVETGATEHSIRAHSAASPTPTNKCQLKRTKRPIVVLPRRR